MRTAQAPQLAALLTHTRRLATVSLTACLIASATTAHAHGVALGFALQLLASSTTATVLLLHLEQRLARLAREIPAAMQRDLPRVNARHAA